MGEFLRKYITPLSLVTFAAVGVTGVMMFVGIHNHGLSELHEKFGIGFVAIAILHLFRNGKGFSLMLKQKRSLAIVGVLGVAACLMVGSALSEAETGHGNPFRAQAVVVERLSNAPIAQIAPALGLSSDQIVARLRQGGIAVEGPEQTLADVARKAERPASQLYALILADQNRR